MAKQKDGRKAICLRTALAIDLGDLGAHRLLVLMGLLIAAEKGVWIPHFYRLLTP